MKKFLSLSACAVILSSMSYVSNAHAQMEPFLGQIMWTGATYCPQGWLPADGQSLSIVDNKGLFAVLGTTYGGDGRSNFALPDLRGRVTVAPGQGKGIENYQQGKVGGSETHTMIVQQLPAHNHALITGAPVTVKTDPAGTSVVGVGTSTTGMSGNSLPVNHMPPYAVLNACVAVQGMFPVRP